MSEELLRAAFADHGIAWEVLEQQAVFTVGESTAIGAKRLSFGKAGDMERLLGVSPGSVTPLAAINDSTGLVRVVIDADLAEADRVNVHPLRNTATVGLAGRELCALPAQWGHEPLRAAIPVRA